VFGTILQIVIAAVSVFTLALLFVGIRHWLPTVMRLKKSVGEQEQAKQELGAKLERIDMMAHHDFLTGLPNRRSFQEALENCLARNRRSGEKTALLFIDLDHFKRINDTLGHQAGDQLLQEFAQRLNGQLRREDVLVHDATEIEDRVISRFGGDEFVVILPTLKSPRDAARVARRFLDSLEKPFTLETNEVYVGASIGIATYPDDGADVEALLKSADLAMYHAKEAGRNRFHYYSAEMNEQTVERLKLESELRRALAQGELELHYQPQIELSSQQIVAVEALVRWRHVDRGWVPADLIISIAEESGLIVHLGEWALREACAQVRRWLDGGMELSVAVNLSSLQFQVSKLHHLVLDILEESEVPASLLNLELTEISIMKDEVNIVPVLKALSESGVGISLDDFGTGYSSLGYLRRLPIDTVKIDCELVNGMMLNEADASVFETIVLIAKAVGLKVVAEGVETAEQREVVEKAGCHLAQGYWFSPPVTATDMEEILAANDFPVADSSKNFLH